jgi:predicted DNA-binding protein (MmcQ/YjbR family)
MDEQLILERLREICLILPGSCETRMHGHPTFRAGKEMFALLHGREGEPAISIKVGKTMQPVFLRDVRFFKTPYIGQHGWISIHASPIMDWEEVAELVKGSHQLVTSKQKKKR